MKYEKKFVEALYEVLAETEWKDEGLEILKNLPESIDNVSLDKNEGLIEFEDSEGRVTYQITIKAVHAARPQ